MKPARKVETPADVTPKGEPPRGHDTHFLERLSRVDEEQMDLALTLYRSPELVRMLLAERAVPGNAGRVAIALAPGPQPAHVVVARSGAFVTCLAAGMGVGGLPAVPHDRVAVLLGRAKHAEDVVARGAAVLEKERGCSLIERLFKAASELTREEFAELQAIEIFFRQRMQMHLIELLNVDEERAIVAAHQRHPGRMRELLREYWNHFHLWCHLILLTSHAGHAAFDYWIEWTRTTACERGLDPARSLFGGVYLLPLLRGERRLVLRLLWALARAGSLALPWLSEMVEQDYPLHVWFASVLALGVIGAAHAKLRRQIARQVARLHVPPGMHPAAAPLLEAVQTAVPRYWDGIAADFPERARALWGGASVEEASPSERDGSMGEACGQDGEAPRSPNVTTELLNVPLDLTVDPRRLPELLWTIGVLGLLPAGAFYFPAADVPALAEPYSEEAAMRLLLWARPSPPVHVGRKPGRNEPCPCGSGRKYKHCCGAT